jgi:cell division protein FtsN
LTVIYTAQSEIAQKKTRGALLPLLVVLFLISYGILTLLVVEQGRTIDAQRNLLREMLKDSTQLATLRNKLAREDSAQSHDKSATQTQQKEAASGSSPSVAPKTPSKETKHPGKTARTLKSIPEKPAADLQDVRRSTRVI